MHPFNASIPAAALILLAMPALAAPPRIDEAARRLAASGEPVAVAARCAAAAATAVFSATDAGDRARREGRERVARGMVGRVAVRTGVAPATAEAVLFLAMDGVATRSATLTPGVRDGGADAACNGMAADPEGYLDGLGGR